MKTKCNRKRWKDNRFIHAYTKKQIKKTMQHFQLFFIFVLFIFIIILIV